MVVWMLIIFITNPNNVDYLKTKVVRQYEEQIICLAEGKKEARKQTRKDRHVDYTCEALQI